MHSTIDLSMKVHSVENWIRNLAKCTAHFGLGYLNVRLAPLRRR